MVKSLKMHRFVNGSSEVLWQHMFPAMIEDSESKLEA